MREDIERWERRYRQQGRRADAVEPLLAEREDLFGGTCRVLDVACGRGANALHLAARGHLVWGVDGSLTALSLAREAARERGLGLLLFAADLDRYPLPEARFDRIVVMRYLNRALAPALACALRPGGILVHKTFNRRHLADTPTFNPAYLLAPGELLALYPMLEVLESDDGPAPASASTYLVARRRITVR